ncbi:MAG: metallophosphoesterase [Bacteroidales bacterium]|jgi:3',5'-cyclic AMP phosphodiesterase CpdA|nr:metallophosphoesterase [Bacteroidales bacterium]
MKKALIRGIAIAIVSFTVLLFMNSCKTRKEGSETFNVAFLTDIHIDYRRNAVAGVEKALDSVNALNPDFIITGGDLIMDALGQSYGRADSLYNLYQETIRKASVPVYNTMGNHEIYGIYSRSGADPLHPEYGEKMYEKRIGQSYYSFMHKGWKFMILNSIEDTGKDRYVGLIDSVQAAWITKELESTDQGTPIVISTHIPFITVMDQRYEGSTVPNDSSLVVYNSRQVLDLFREHNLKLVLQGHLHILEDIYYEGVRYITGGAVCGGWWRGPYRTCEEGFLWLTFGKDDFTWKYVDYNWVASE